MPSQVERPEWVVPELSNVTWTTLPDLPRLPGPTILPIGRMFFLHSPTTIFKLGVDDGEDIMTAFAYSTLEECVPRVISVVTLSPNSSDATSPPPRVQRGLVLTLQPGKPLEELWPSLSLTQRGTVKSRLCDLLLRMRARPYDYYGRPRETRGADSWDRPVLTHGDLSDRNIIVDPDTLAITGLIDWERANIAPAYFEYVAARLTGGHEPEWRKELLEVLRAVLRRECDSEATARGDGDLKGRAPPGGASIADPGEAKYRRTMAAWDAIVDVERSAQEYNDNFYWTFETGLPVSPA